MRRETVAALLLPAFFVGCGGDDTQAGDGTETTGNTDSAGTGSSSNGSEGSGGASTDSGAGSTSDTTGTGGGQEGPLFPLPIGASWTYQVAQVGGTTCPEGVHTAEVTQMVETGGRQAVEYVTYCGGTASPIVAEGDRVEVWLPAESAWGLALDEPVEEGYSWEFGFYSLTYTWEFAGTVEVTAGTFDACWNRVDAWTVATYCRDVGKVLEERDGDYLAELTDFELP